MLDHLFNNAVQRMSCIRLWFAMDENIVLEIDWPEGAFDYAKGYISDVLVRINGQSFEFTFYEPVRLRQDVEGELKYGPLFFRNLVVVDDINAENIELALKRMIKRGELPDMKR